MRKILSFDEGDYQFATDKKGSETVFLTKEFFPMDVYYSACEVVWKIAKQGALRKRKK